MVAYSETHCKGWRGGCIDVFALQVHNVRSALACNWCMSRIALEKGFKMYFHAFYILFFDVVWQDMYIYIIPTGNFCHIQIYS